jgi:hypothetical protein
LAGRKHRKRYEAFITALGELQARLGARRARRASSTNGIRETRPRIAASSRRYGARHSQACTSAAAPRWSEPSCGQTRPRTSPLLAKTNGYNPSLLRLDRQRTSATIGLRYEK